MYSRYLFIIVLVCSLFCIPESVNGASANRNEAAEMPTKIYVPYEELKTVFEKEGQGVFLPYSEFQKLWRAASGKPATVTAAPFEYLISTARFNGKVKDEIAEFKLELTIDILGSGWVQVPLGLSTVAVSEAKMLDSKNAEFVPLLQLVDGQYIFNVKGAGRYVLTLNFVKQLETQPGLAVLKYNIPSAVITTVDLMIPEANLKVDVEPMLAATTSGATEQAKEVTRLQAFLGSAKEVRLSWKPRIQAAQDLEKVVVCEQFQHINVEEALISNNIKLNYNIHRGEVNSFSIRLPADFRVTDVNGANIAKWDIESLSSDRIPTDQMLKVILFSSAKDQYNLTIKMERFLQQDSAQIQLVPIITEQAFRQSGLIGITYSPRRSVHLEDVKNLARVDTGQLPGNLQGRAGVTAYRFIASDYSGKMKIDTTLPRISVTGSWMLGVNSDRLELQGRIQYKVERTGVFELNIKLPEPWVVETLGPETIVDDHQFKGQGQNRWLHILLRAERTGNFELRLTARSSRAQPDEVINFALPVPDANNLQSYEGQLVLALAEQLRAEVEQLQQIRALSLRNAQMWTSMSDMSPVMAYEFSAIDPVLAAGGRFKIAVKPSQISAAVHRLVNIQSGSIEHEAVVQYQIRYAPVDTFYLRMPAQFADAGVEIIGDNIKEKPRIDALPADQQGDSNDVLTSGKTWAYYKIVLQSKISGSYQLRVQARRTFLAGQAGQSATVDVPPVLAAGKLSDQAGYIAIAKADTLAIGEPNISNLTPADASSAVDLPYAPHRRQASLAFKYNRPSYLLTLPVVVQKEAAVFTTIVNGAIIEQVLARDGMLNTYATFLLATSQGNRLTLTLPEGAELTAVLLNGEEAPVEVGTKSNERIIRLPPSAGQVAKFVVEVAYGLKKASASSLAAPTLPADIPVQQTLWRLWIPDGVIFLGHSRAFSRIPDYQIYNMINTLQSGQTRPVSFKLAGQGQALSFVRQGRCTKLYVMAAGREFFYIMVWVIIVAAGVFMLKLNGFRRVLIILAAGLLAGIIHLYQPILVRQFCKAGVFAAVLVLLLWFAQWGRLKLPQLRLAIANRRKAALEKKQQIIDEKKGRDA
jgi:hypothetical protein